MKTVFTLIIFILFAIIAFLLINFILSSLVGVSFFGGSGGGRGSAGGVLVSRDKGENWEFRNQVSEIKNLSRADVLDILFDPHTPDVIYLTTKGNGFFKSEDGANSWTEVVDKNQALNPTAYIYEVAKDPKDANNVYLAAYQGGMGRILRSGDGGEGFREVYVVSSEGESVSGVIVDWYDPSIIFAVTSSGLLLKSIDYGTSWEKVNEFEGPIKKAYMNPQDSREIYIVLSAPQKLFKTSNKGGTWEDLTPALKDFQGASNILDLLIDPSSSRILYLASEFGLLKSKDGGATFSEVKTIIPSESLPVLAVDIDPRNSDIIYLAAKTQFYKSEDGGTKWQVKNLPTSVDAKILKVDPSSPDVLYIGLGAVEIKKKGSLF